MIKSGTKRLACFVLTITSLLPVILASSGLQHTAMLSPRDGRERIPRGYSLALATRSDYRPWKPLQHGNPLARDPTLFYLPPMIERMHVGAPQLPHRNPVWPVRPKNPSVVFTANTNAAAKAYRTNYHQHQVRLDRLQPYWNQPNPRITLEPFRPEQLYKMQQNGGRSVNTAAETPQQQRSDFLAPLVESHRRNDILDYPRNNTRNGNGGTLATVTLHQPGTKAQNSTQRRQRNRSALPVSDFFIQQGHSRVQKFGS